MTDGVKRSGKVFLVGAGPGDPELLTVKARRIIDSTDVILYDSLTSEQITELFPSTVIAIDVGKRPTSEGGRTSQDEINRLMVEHAMAGRTVARLKGGDPTVYGRGGEEAQRLAREDVPFEIVPGVTSVVAAPGIVGIPLTHRDYASSVTVITGHEQPDKERSALDWESLSQGIRRGGTLVVLMGVATLPRTVRKLRQAGVSSETPAAMIERATWTDETVITGRLETIVEDADAAGISPPAITVVGDVVGVRDDVIHALERGRTREEAETDSEFTTMPRRQAVAGIPASDD